MNGEEVRPQRGERPCGFGHGVGDVEELEIEEDLLPHPFQSLNSPGSYPKEEGKADLEVGGRWKALDQGLKTVFVDIQGDEDSFAEGLHGTISLFLICSQRRRSLRKDSLSFGSLRESAS